MYGDVEEADITTQHSELAKYSYAYYVPAQRCMCYYMSFPVAYITGVASCVVKCSAATPKTGKCRGVLG